METQPIKQQTLSEFMTPGKAMRVWQIIFAVLLSAMLIGAVYEFTKPEAEPVRMSTALSGDTYCYLDVVMVSNWLLKVTGEQEYTLYEAMDPDENWYLLGLDDDAYAQLSAQYAAYNAYNPDSQTNQLPAPIRLTGMTYKLDTDDAQQIASIYDNVTSDTVINFYGQYYFSEGVSNSSEGAVLYLVGAFVFGLLFLTMILQSSRQRKNYQKSDTRLYELGKTVDAEAEFSSTESVRFPKAKLILSKQFVFCGSSGWVLPYEEIDLAYQRTQRSYGIAVGKQIIAGLINGKTVVLANRYVNDALLTETARAIYTANPNCLIGYSFDNIKTYRQRVKEYKQNHPK